MPKKPSDYSKCVIYKIVCKDLKVEESYVGHTTNFKSRKSRHKSNCEKPESAKHNFKIYKFIRDNGGWDNWEMIEIEKFPCNDENEARSRERYWYEVLNSSLNTLRPLRHDYEYREQLKEHKKKYKLKHPNAGKEYYQRNKDKINVHVICECGFNSIKTHLARHRESKSHELNLRLKCFEHLPQI